MSTPKDTFVSIDADNLEAVAGGASRAPSKGDDSLNLMLTQITSSIKDLANQNNKGGDPMQLMLMMLMLGGGGGGGGGGVVGGGCGVGSPIINVSANVRGGGCRRKGKKGW